MGLRFDPVGGGQFKTIVKQIIEAERAPIKQLEARKTREEAKNKLFQEFKSKFNTVQKSIDDISSMKKLRELKVDLGPGEGIVSVTLDKEKALPGDYEVEVTQLAHRPSVLSNTFKDADEKLLGMGFIVMKMANGEEREIFVEPENGSLNGVAKAINDQPNSIVQASVVRDATDPENPWRLIISGKKDGAEQDIEFPDLYFLDGDEDIYYDDTRSAENSKLKIDGFEMQLNSNDLNEFLPGVNLHLKAAKPGQPFMLKITEDYQKISGKIKEVVTQLNTILEFINKQNQVDEKTDTRTTFAGDTSLQSMEYRIRNLVHEAFPILTDPEEEEYRLMWLSDLGVEFNRAGALTLNEAKLQQTMEKDFMGIAEAITGEQGFASQLKAVIGIYTRPGVGLLATREQGLKRRLTEMDRQIENKERQVERKAQAVTDQFSRLQGTIGAMQQQQQQVSAALGGGGGGNMISQLLG